MTTFALTGATGLVGSHLLFEIVKQNLNRLSQIRIYVLGRHKAGKSLQERLINLFAQSGYSYLGTGYDPRELDHFLRHQLIGLELSLDQPAGFSAALQALRHTPIDYFFHLAALPDLRDRPETEAKVMRVNYTGTQRLLDLVRACQVKEFDFIGTAFVCGKHGGRIAPDFLNPDGQFNNPYEKSKMLAEMAVRDFAFTSDIRFRIFRPSIVCGRLMETPLGYVSKFDVFYQLFGFFYLLKALLNGNTSASSLTDLQLRIVFSSDSSANFVPVDYLVKLLYQICLQDTPGDSFHLVNEKNSNYRDFLAAAAEEMKITGVTAVSRMPVDQTFSEQLFYSRIGNLFEAYLNAPPKIFDTSNEQQVIRRAGLVCPEMDSDAVRKLIRYAIQKHFGLQMNKVLAKMKMGSGLGT
jgi:nucleoside-diphosphate-sugar epimerase